MDKTYYEHIDETIYSEKLPNGLQVFLLPKQEMSKTFGIFCTNYGSIDHTFTPIGETEQITVPDGVAHFLEHKLFEKKDRDVFTDFSNQGASANAFTSFTKTAYLFSATNNIEKNVKTLLDFVQDPYFSDESVEKEKGIIAQEIKMYDDQPDWRSFMGTLQTMFKNHPITIDIAGTVDSIHTITKDHLYTCYHTFYHPENMILFIAGNFEPNQMSQLIRDNQTSKTFEPLKELRTQYPKEPEHAYMDEKTIHMPVSIPKCTVGIKESVKPLEKEEFLKKDLLQQMILDHYFSKGGKFYQILYEENLIDNSFFYQTTLEKNFGYSLIGGNTDKPDEFIQRMKELLMSVKGEQLTEADVDRMKKRKIGQVLRSMNSLEYIANNYIHYAIADIDFFQVIPEIESLTREDIQHFIKNWIDEERLSVCKIMPQ